MSPAGVAITSLVVVAAIMLLETRVSRANELRLRAQGAVEPAGDVYRIMQIAYPSAFVLMALEGALTGPRPGLTTVVGALVFLLAKGLKFWAIASLGPRWTFRVLVPPGAVSVTSGPYSLISHPNYVAVVGELVGMAVLVGARVTGPFATALFGMLMWRRIRIENDALRYPPCS